MKNKHPLIVDLDESLLKTDSLYELFFAAIAQKKLSLFMSFIRGRQVLKRALAEGVSLDLTLLPWNAQVVELCKAAHAEKRPIYLATAANKYLAACVVAHFPFFDGFIASDEHTNLKGSEKAQALVNRFGEKNFTYIGDARCDVEVWKHAAEAFVVGNISLLKTVKKYCPQVTFLKKDSNNKLEIFRSMRVHQWSKNILLFFPLILSHQFNINNIYLIINAALCFCMISSATYIINDLLDLSADRVHITKKFRSFASGNLRIQTGIVCLTTLLLSGFIISISIMPIKFLIIISLYFLITTFYSFFFKEILLVDILILSILYTLRIISGAIILDFPVTSWLLGFSFFTFFSLSIMKRLIEINNIPINVTIPLYRRGYTSDDFPVLLSIASASCFASVLTLALYIGDSRSLKYYSNVQILFILCPILIFWMSRLLIYINRGKILCDPVYFVLHDKVSYICMLLGLIIFIIAS